MDQKLSQDLLNRLKKNEKKLRSWIKKNKISCYRLYDADLPEYNFAIDVYEERVHLQEYQVKSSKIDEKKMQQRLDQGKFSVAEFLKISPEKVFVKSRLRQKGIKQYEKEKKGSFFKVSEGGLIFRANLETYLDSGLFLDHRIMRSKIREEAKGKDFLNLFCYTGAVSVYAAAGGAKTVTSVDLSKTYLDWGKQNFSFNDLSSDNSEFIHADCLEWVKQKARNDQMKGASYDLIFLDPPSFSNSKRMDDTWDVQRDHKSLISLCIKCLRPGGKLYFSNNLRTFKMEYETSQRISVKEITKETTSVDFARRPLHKCYLLEKKLIQN